MSKRVSHSLLDPFYSRLIPGIYGFLRIPRQFPPEGIVLAGHLLAAIGGLGFALAGKYTFAGLLVVLGLQGITLQTWWMARMQNHRSVPKWWRTSGSFH